MPRLPSLWMAVLALSPAVAFAEMVGDFAPLGLTNKWTYAGSIGQGFPTLSSPKGVLTRQSDSVYRTVEVTKEMRMGDTVVFEVTKKDSIPVRSKTYVFQTLASNGSLASTRTVDSLEKRDSVALAIHTVAIVGDKLIFNNQNPGCDCALAGFMESMFASRFYDASKASDTTYASETRKRVYEAWIMAARGGYDFRTIKIEDIGLVSYRYTWWSSNNTSFEIFTLRDFGDSSSSINRPIVQAKGTGKSRDVKRASGYRFGFHNGYFDAAGKRVGAIGN